MQLDSALLVRLWNIAGSNQLHPDGNFFRFFPAHLNIKLNDIQRHQEQQHLFSKCCFCLKIKMGNSISSARCFMHSFIPHIYALCKIVCIFPDTGNFHNDTNNWVLGKLACTHTNPQCFRRELGKCNVFNPSYLIEMRKNPGELTKLLLLLV